MWAMTSTPVASPFRSRLHTASAALGVIALVQFAFGVIAAMRPGGAIQTTHGWFGYLATVVAILVAVIAWRYAQHTGRKGTFYHALSLPILCIIQIGLAQSGAKWIHMILGIVYLTAVGGLFAMSNKD